MTDKITTCIRIDVDIMKKIRQISEKDRRNLAATVNIALEEYIQRRENELKAKE